VAVVNDWNLNPTDLARYKVLILPNTACLDEAQAAAVKQFVHNGGGLVASLDASLFDVFGNPRNNFALADVFGVDYRGLPEATVAKKEDIDINFAKSIGPDYWEKRQNVFDFKQDTGSLLNQGRMKTYVGEDVVTFKGPAVRVAVKGKDAKVIGTLQAKGVLGAASFPGVVTNAYGKGRVVSLPADSTPRITSTPILISVCVWPTPFVGRRPRPSRSRSMRPCACTPTWFAKRKTADSV